LIFFWWFALFFNTSSYPFRDDFAHSMHDARRCPRYLLLLKDLIEVTAAPSEGEGGGASGELAMLESVRDLVLKSECVQFFFYFSISRFFFCLFLPILFFVCTSQHSFFAFLRLPCISSPPAIGLFPSLLP
jgi:hypothetical protein